MKMGNTTRRNARRSGIGLALLTAMLAVTFQPGCATMSTDWTMPDPQELLNPFALGELIASYTSELLAWSYGSITFSGSAVTPGATISIGQISPDGGRGMFASAATDRWQDNIATKESVYGFAALAPGSVELHAVAGLSAAEPRTITIHPPISLATASGTTLKQTAPEDPYGLTHFPETPFGSGLFADPAQRVGVPLSGEIVLVAAGGKPDRAYTWTLVESPAGTVLTADTSSDLNCQATLTAPGGGNVTVAIGQDGCSWSVEFPFALTVDTSAAHERPSEVLPADRDGDGTPDVNDGCPDDPQKTQPGACGCGAPDADRDGDGTLNCLDGCPDDPFKTGPGACGCGVPDVDADNSGVADCLEGDVLVTILVRYEIMPVAEANVQVQGCCPADGVKVCEGLTAPNGQFTCGSFAQGTQLWVYAYHDGMPFVHGQAEITVANQGGGTMLAVVDVMP